MIKRSFNHQRLLSNWIIKVSVVGIALISPTFWSLTGCAQQDARTSKSKNTQVSPSQAPAKKECNVTN